MDIFVQLHVYKKSLKLKKKVPKNFVKILKEVEETYSTKDVKVRFSFLKDGSANFINAGSIIKGYVLFNAEWAAYLILFNEDDTKNAFLITLGHELTHKEGDLPNKLKYSKSDQKFINWINEIHADFGGTQKFFNLNKKMLVNSCEYKRKCKEKDIDYFSHPSWQKRKYYAENYNFDETLIRRIAKDTNCKNEKYIQKAIEYFKPIILI